VVEDISSEELLEAAKYMLALAKELPPESSAAPAGNGA